MNSAPSLPNSQIEPVLHADGDAQMLAFSELDHAPDPHAPPVLASLSRTIEAPTNPLHHVRTNLTVRIGTAQLSIGELLTAREQQVLRLDQRIDQPVDVLLEGHVVARGTLIAVDDCFGVRITELPRPLKP